MFDNNLQNLFILIASFVASFSAVAAGMIMVSVTKNFKTGILSYGFKSIAIGIIFVAFGIIIDSLGAYLLVFKNPNLNTLLLILKEASFVIGAYIIVIGSKRTADKMQTLTKQ